LLRLCHCQDLPSLKDEYEITRVNARLPDIYLTEKCYDIATNFTVKFIANYYISSRVEEIFLIMIIINMNYLTIIKQDCKVFRLKVSVYCTV